MFSASLSLLSQRTLRLCACTPVYGTRHQQLYRKKRRPKNRCSYPRAPERSNRTAKKKGALQPLERPVYITYATPERRLEGDLTFDLDQPRRSIAAQERTKNARWRVHLGHNFTKCAAADVAHRVGEVRMVEQVEELESELERAALPVRNRKLLQHVEVGVEVARSAERAPQPLGPEPGLGA